MYTEAKYKYSVYGTLLYQIVRLILQFLLSLYGFLLVSVLSFVRGIHSSLFSELLVIRFVTDDFKTNMSLMYLGTQLFNDLYTIIAVRSITLCRIGRTPAALNSGREEVSFGISMDLAWPNQS
jgi:hypothetical protein